MTTPVSRIRQRLGNSLMVVGVALIGGFFAFRAWNAHESNAGIEVFEALRDAATEGSAIAAEPPSSGESTVQFASVNPSELPEPAPAFPADSLNTEPNQALWSSQRVAAYEQAIATNDAAPLGVLTIDHLDIRVPVFNGATDLNLNRGVARIIGTSRVEAPGNLGIAGHRDSFFRPLKDIALGDTFKLETLAGAVEYRVSSIEIVEPDDLHVLAPTDAPMVTLVTCYPFYHVGNAPQRFIVKAEALSNQVNS